MYNVYGSQNEFVKRITRVFILRMRSLGQNDPLRRNIVFAVASIIAFIGISLFPMVVLNAQHKRPPHLKEANSVIHFKGSMTHLQMLQTSAKFLLQIGTSSTSLTSKKKKVHKAPGPNFNDLSYNPKIVGRTFDIVSPLENLWGETCPPPPPIDAHD